MCNRVLCVCGAVSVCLAAVSAQAASITVLVDPSFGSTENTGAQAAITLSFSQHGADEWLAVTLDNITSAAVGSKLTAAGFELPPSLPRPVSFAPGGTSRYFDELTFKDSVSPGWMNAPGGYDVMITSDRSFEGGSAQGAPASGQSQTVVLNLGDTALTPTQLADAFASYYQSLTTPYVIGRFQAVGPSGADSDKVLGRMSGQSTHAPDPATVLILGIGGAALLRRKRTAAP